MHTVHIDDVAGALYACATWMAKLGRAEADRIAGEVIPFHNDAAKVAEVEGMPPASARIVAPLFNLVRLSLLPSRVFRIPFLMVRAVR